MFVCFFLSLGFYAPVITIKDMSSRSNCSLPGIDILCD